MPLRAYSDSGGCGALSGTGSPKRTRGALGTKRARRPCGTGCACAKCTFCSVGTDAACSSGTAGVGKRAQST